LADLELCGHIALHRERRQQLIELYELQDIRVCWGYELAGLLDDECDDSRQRGEDCSPFHLNRGLVVFQLADGQFFLGCEDLRFRDREIGLGTLDFFLPGVSGAAQGLELRESLAPKLSFRFSRPMSSAELHVFSGDREQGRLDIIIECG